MPDAARTDVYTDYWPLVVAKTPANARHERAAIALVFSIAASVAVIAPFAHIPLARVDAFLPAIQTTLSAADLLTAGLLLVQYLVQPQRSLLALGCGYICSGLFAFLQTLAFPGAYASLGLIGDGFNTAPWLFVLWHTSFPLGILVYAFLKDGNASETLFGLSAAQTITVTVGAVLLVAALLAWWVVSGVAYLPELYSSNVLVQTPFGVHANTALSLWCTSVIVILFIRRRTVLDLWLIVVLCAWIPSFLIGAVTAAARFSLGWYAARGFTLLASCVLLAVLLAEMLVLYSRLANAITLLRRERANRLMSLDAATASIAHEVRTPLGAIALNANSAVGELDASEPNLPEVRQILRDIEADSYRVEATISSTRALFKDDVGTRSPAHLPELVRQALSLMQHDIELNDIELETNLPDGIPLVLIDKMQIQQVVLNLLRNSVDALSRANRNAKMLSVAMRRDGNSLVRLSVEDNGPGISTADQDRIFDAFFTTKASGMGLGLSICRTIVERHAGKLELVKSDSFGSRFEVSLPQWLGPE